MHVEAQRLIERLELQPHPEGGYFRQTYRSSMTIETPRGVRRWITSIYYLLADNMFSAFHRLTSDEIWHHYFGSAVAIEVIDPDGQYRTVIVGNMERRQAVIGAGSWFAAHLCDDRGYALVGCDVAPGFEYEDFEIGQCDQLVASFPQHRALIERWTREE
jgi:uncharacterized protein